MQHRTWSGLPALLLCLPSLALAAEETSPMRKATKAEWPVRWYIPPDEGPVVGNQNGWSVTPHDILPGDFTFSGTVENVTDDSFEMTPNSVWGRYRFKMTRVDPADQPTNDLKLRNVVPVRDIHFADLSKLTADNTLLLGGTLTTIGADRKTFVAEIGFKDGPLTCRLDQTLEGVADGQTPTAKHRQGRRCCEEAPQGAGKTQEGRVD